MGSCYGKGEVNNKITNGSVSQDTQIPSEQYTHPPQSISSNETILELKDEHNVIKHTEFPDEVSFVDSIPQEGMKDTVVEVEVKFKQFKSCDAMKIFLGHFRDDKKTRSFVKGIVTSVAVSDQAEEIFSTFDESISDILFEKLAKLFYDVVSLSDFSGPDLKDYVIATTDNNKLVDVFKEAKILMQMRSRITTKLRGAFFVTQKGTKYSPKIHSDAWSRIHEDDEDDNDDDKEKEYIVVVSECPGFYIGKGLKKVSVLEDVVLKVSRKGE
eukprot:TRINITY_DN5280_c2_g2_i1.p1 TRINITY_DN5280_c2_g2~~TRINITY_DN5280_c2_g2_i1.p1  ORF type:complete len:270 (+),score=35.43 TRINITY_DN5280_c2_g2_i1:87-896(+)